MEDPAVGRLGEALKAKLGPDYDDFTPEDLGKLVSARINERNLSKASRETLLGTGIPAVLVDILLKAYQTPPPGISSVQMEMLEAKLVQAVKQEVVQVVRQEVGEAVKQEVVEAVRQEVVEAVKQEMVLPRKMFRMILSQQMGPVSHSSKSSKADYREKAISFYYPDLNVNAKPNLRCMLTGEEFNYEEVIAAHIYQRGWNRAFRKAMGFKIHDSGNLLLLVAAAERKLDQFQWTLKPLSPEMHVVDGVIRLMQPYKVLVLNPRLLDQPREQLIADHLCSIRWADVQGKVLWFGGGEDEAKPLRRVCGLHAMQAIEHAKEQSWLESTGDSPRRLSGEDLMIDEAAWASPTFNKERVEAFLHDLPDDFDESI